MLNPILPRVQNSGSGGEPLTPADFPEADVVLSEDRVLLAIEGEFASATVEKILEPIVARLDDLQHQIDNIETSGLPSHLSSSTNLSTSGLASGAPEILENQE